jgi:hypothetical protein
MSKPDIFPLYYVSEPDSDELEDVYYKIVDENGPVFWRNEGDDTGKKIAFSDLLFESKNGFGLEELQQEETPWKDE